MIGGAPSGEGETSARNFSQSECKEFTTLIVNNLDHLIMNKLTDTEVRVLRVVKKHMGLLALEVELHSTFKTDLECGSIEIIEVLMKTENEFKIELADDLFQDNFDGLTVSGVVKMVDGVINE